MPLRQIITDLQDPDPATRSWAVDSLRRLGTAEAAGALVFVLGDPDPSVRARAAAALAAIGEPAAEPLARYLAAWDGSLGTVIPELLGRLRTTAGLDLLLQHLDEPDPLVRSAIARALGAISLELARSGSDNSAALSRAKTGLLDLLRDIEPEVQIAAAGALGQLGDPETCNALLDEMADDNPAVRRAAVEALGRIGDKQSANALARAAADDPSPEVRSAADFALRSISDRTVGSLVELLTSDALDDRIRALALLLEEGRSAVMPLTELLRRPEPAVRSAAAEALGMLGEPAALDYLLPLVGDGESSVRLAVVRALGRIRHVRSAERLAAAIEDQDPKVSGAAAGALEALGELSVEPMFQLLTSPCAETRVRAIAVLGRLRHKGAVNRLLRGLRDRVAWVRIVSAQALGEIGEGQATTALLRILDDRDAVVRAMAAEALGKLRDFRASMKLLDRVRDCSDLVRANSIRALGRIGNPVAVPFVTSALGDESVEVRCAAIEALAALRVVEAIPRLRALSRPWPLCPEPAEVKRVARSALAILEEIRQLQERTPET
uniref:HEAT repeat domain-containing protein n=1 Tax=candidate division WOR-3 bacterium TaxID=2052148 RepID=A0A7C4CCI5_UNCW3